MRRILESDTGVYVTAGAFMIVVFVVGFAIFVGIYFFSMAAYGYLSR